MRTTEPIRFAWRSIARLAVAVLALASPGCATTPPPGPPRVYTEQEVRDFGTEMSSFLTSLAQRQEYQRAEGRYAPTFGDLGLGRPSGYDVRIVEAHERGWSAEAFRPNPRMGCSIFVGVVNALPQPANMVQSQAGRPYCVFVPQAD
jgi:hypothetical protein